MAERWQYEWLETQSVPGKRWRKPDLFKAVSMPLGRKGAVAIWRWVDTSDEFERAVEVLIWPSTYHAREERWAMSARVTRFDPNPRYGLDPEIHGGLYDKDDPAWTDAPIEAEVTEFALKTVRSMLLQLPESSPAHRIRGLPELVRWIPEMALFKSWRNAPDDFEMYYTLPDNVQTAPVGPGCGVMYEMPCPE